MAKRLFSRKFQVLATWEPFEQDFEKTFQEIICRIRALSSNCVQTRYLGYKG